MKKLLFATVLMASLFSINGFAQSKNRMDLDDLMIKGEIHNDDRLMILARQKNELKNFVKFRTSFRDEMLQELPSSQTR